MRVAVVGCGNIGLHRHVPALQAIEGVTIAAVADPTPARLREAQQAVGLADEQCHADWREAVARDNVDAVVIATPQRFRPQIATAAARARKHLLCEKPLALAPADAQAMVDAAHDNGVLLATVHNYTRMPVFQTVRAIVEAGTIGAIETVLLNFLSVEDRPGTAGYRPRWRHDVREAGGGVLMDMLHAVYLANWLVGAEPRAVSATVDQRLPGGGDVEDYALVRYDYPHAHALINMAWGAGPGGVELMGTKGRVVLTSEGFGTIPFVAPTRLYVISEAGVEEQPADQGFGASIEHIVREWIAAIEAGRPVMTPGEDGVTVLEAVVGAYESAALGREVRLPLDPGDPVYRLGAPGIAFLDVPEESVVWQRRLYGVEGRRPA